MELAPRDVVITGLGAVSAIGADCASLWDAVAAGRSGIGPISRFATTDFAVHTGAVVRDPAAKGEPGEAANMELCRRFAVAAGREALAAAGLPDGAVPSSRLALVFGTGLGDNATPVHTLAEEVAACLGAVGPRLTVSTACSSSTGAIGLGRDLLDLNAADAVLAGGSDVLSPHVFAGFHALGVLSRTACAPFSHPFGTTLGEGAGFVVLERGRDARERGARVQATLDGYGLSGDAYHETSPDPHGAGVERAIRGALEDAGLAPAALDYANVHGSGTEANDPAEWRGIQRALGARAASIPLSSTKGALGHAQGAAGVLEAIVTILAMSHGVVPPTLNFTKPRPYGPPDPVPGPQPRPGLVRHALSLNAAFGGANAALVLSRADAALPQRPRLRRAVHILGVGLVGPWGVGADAFVASRGCEGRVPEFDLAMLVPQADLRGLDPVSRYLTAAAALALRDGGVQLRGALRDRVGLLAGQLGGSPESLAAFQRSIDEHGLAHLSAAAFARIVLNAAAGACSKLLSLRGPLSAVTTGAGTGLVSLVLAAEMLSTREGLACMLAGGADEAGDGGSEGACYLLLGRGADGPAAPVRVTGWGVAGPGQGAAAAAHALAMDGAGPAPTVVEARADCRAMSSALAAAEAVLAIRRGEASRILVTSNGGGSATAAVVFARV
jgi:3-oxoacyl-[acyl-carrier-protein] synthase II